VTLTEPTVPLGGQRPGPGSPQIEARAARVVVCLPTYNERENLEAMVRALGDVLPPQALVLVVDDGSPDGTGDLAERLAEGLAFVRVLHRPVKEGLGPAYVAGFRHALELGADFVVQIDCDFSHDPRDVPRLVAAAEDADLAIGSRYVSGGAVANWSARRHGLSRAGSLYSRTLLGTGVADLTGGFKCFRREVLETIDIDSIRSRGYAFQIETTYRALRAGFRVVEVPITFTERRVGGSKMTGSIAFEALWRVPLLRARATAARR
jgi:dolichol-phosphate mannosyltransferase